MATAVLGPSLTDTLCTQCGLCCDGSLFADVELTGQAEATRLEVLGLEIEDDGSDRALLQLPCRALRGRLCGIYPHRPKCCRTFECGLLQSVRRGTVGVELAGKKIRSTLKQIERVKDLMSQLGYRDRGLPLAESCAETLARDLDADPNVNRKRDALEAAMGDVQKSIQRTFLSITRT